MIAILVSFFGALGAVVRFLLDVGAKEWVERSSRFSQVVGAKSFGIFAVNVLGSFLSGLAFALAWSYGGIWVGLAGGFLSGFTTFSTAMVDVLTLHLEGHSLRALGLWASQFLLALLAAFAGVGLGFVCF
ncbi:CrcB family protein [Actinomycetaceae bacterium TAE3-ERU4]|nr:CrcB family protein [Actinomycetaceae bacterium TAE3-ERU4]